MIIVIFLSCNKWETTIYDINGVKILKLNTNKRIITLFKQDNKKLQMPFDSILHKPDDTFLNEFSKLLANKFPEIENGELNFSIYFFIYESKLFGVRIEKNNSKFITTKNIENVIDKIINTSTYIESHKRILAFQFDYTQIIYKPILRQNKTKGYNVN
jgi:hypothetical protein